MNFKLTKVKSVGLLIDESKFLEKEKLIEEIISNGILRENIKVIIYRDKLKNNEVFSFPTFSLKNLNWNGEFSETVVKEFIQEPFDLLINYYDNKKPALMLITQQSKSYFKVGFSTTDLRLNHFIVDTNSKNFKTFTFEMFKYLKILNKI